jgi:hypothetical protein
MYGVNIDPDIYSNISYITVTCFGSCTCSTEPSPLLFPLDITLGILRKYHATTALQCLVKVVTIPTAALVLQPIVPKQPDAPDYANGGQ